MSASEIIIEIAKCLGAEEEYMDCPCCGDVAAEGLVSDGQPLLCGCAGHISVDGESDPFVSGLDDPCPKWAKCNGGSGR